MLILDDTEWAGFVFLFALTGNRKGCFEEGFMFHGNIWI